MAFGQNLDRGVVAVEPLSGQDVGFETLEHRLHHGAHRTELIGQGGEAERHAFGGKLLGQAVQGLVLNELLIGDQGQEAGAGPAARDNVEASR